MDQTYHYRRTENVINKAQYLYGGSFGLAFTMSLLHVERFSTFMLPQKTTPASFTKFAGYLLWEVSFSVTEISLILKNKMAALGISLTII